MQDINYILQHLDLLHGSSILIDLIDHPSLSGVPLHDRKQLLLCLCPGLTTILAIQVHITT